MKKNTLSSSPPQRVTNSERLLKECKVAINISKDLGIDPTKNPNYQDADDIQKLTLQLVALSLAIKTILDNPSAHAHAKEALKQIRRGEGNA